MTRNVGTLDRIIRIVVGIAVLSLPVLLQGSLRWLGLIGLVPLVTGLVGWCPAYSLLGISSCEVRTHKPG
ncbi:DUF2892 domain-containing protein [bacterium]|nr:MAG: DUF2892 domain-containing protein [bacterium]